VILDAGVLISVDRGEDAAQVLLAARGSDSSLHTTHPVLAQVLRDGSRQAREGESIAESYRQVPQSPAEDAAALANAIAMTEAEPWRYKAGS